MYVERDQKIFHSEEGKVQILLVVNANAKCTFFRDHQNIETVDCTLYR